MEKVKCRLLTLDVWDTILRRTCHPDEIKVKTAQEFLDRYGSQYHIIASAKELAKLRIKCERKQGFCSKKRGYDDEYEIHDVLQNWCEELLKSSVTEINHIVEELVEFEVKTELEHTYQDTEILNFISNIEFERLALVSDFYMTKELIERIIVGCGFHLKIDKMYISCECLYNKRSGRLFEHVREIENVEFEEWIHVGDNSHSDVEIPLSKGIMAIHYLPKQEVKLRNERESSFSWDDDARHVHAGDRHIAAFFFGFVTWIIEEALKRNIKVIYFFTREGELYKEIYNEINSHNPFGKALPDARVIEVSRMSTFMPSLREITPEEFMRIWNQYSVQSMKALFKSLCMDITGIRKYLEHYGISEEESIQYPWQDERVRKLFSDQAFVAALELERNKKRMLLCEYLSAKGWKQNHNDAIGIVDIGWRGTIQDNLCYLYPQYMIYGFYIGLIPFLSPQPANSRKYGYLNDYKWYHTVLRTLTPFEMLCNSPNGSTTGYEKCANGVYAIRKNEEYEDIVYESFLKNRQKKIKQRMCYYCAEMKRMKYTSESYRDCAYHALHHFITYPDRKTAKAYFSLKHNEEFGVGNFVDKSTRFRPKLLLEAVFKADRRTELIQFLNDTTWAQGYFVKYRLYPVLWIYNLIIKRK